MYYLIFSKEKIIQETHKVPFPFLTCKYELKASLGNFFFSLLSAFLSSSIWSGDSCRHLTAANGHKASRLLTGCVSLGLRSEWHVFLFFFGKPLRNTLSATSLSFVPRPGRLQPSREQLTPASAFGPFSAWLSVGTGSACDSSQQAFTEQRRGCQGSPQPSAL